MVAGLDPAPAGEGQPAVVAHQMDGRVGARQQVARRGVANGDQIEPGQRVGERADVRARGEALPRGHHGRVRQPSGLRRAGHHAEVMRPLVVDVAAADQMDDGCAAQQLDARGQLRAHTEVGDRLSTEGDGRGGGGCGDVGVGAGRGGLEPRVLPHQAPQRVGEQHVRVLGVMQHRGLAGRVAVHHHGRTGQAMPQVAQPTGQQLLVAVVRVTGRGHQVDRPTLVAGPAPAGVRRGAQPVQRATRPLPEPGGDTIRQTLTRRGRRRIDGRGTAQRGRHGSTLPHRARRPAAHPRSCVQVTRGPTASAPAG